MFVGGTDLFKCSLLSGKGLGVTVLNNLSNLLLLSRFGKPLSLSSYFLKNTIQTGIAFLMSNRMK